MSATTNSAEKIAQLAIDAAGGVSTVEVSHGREFILHPPGYVAKEIHVLPQDVDIPLPKWVSQIVNVQNEHSLSDYVNRFKNKDSVLFADIKNNTIVAVIDYHREALPVDLGQLAASNAAETIGVTQVAPQMKSHRAVLTLPHSVEWQTWMTFNESKMDQLSFVSFLEDNAVDVVQPDGAGLLELVRDLEGTKNVKWGSTVRAGNVDKLDFVRETGAQAKGNVELPLQIQIGIPVYFGDDRVTMTAMLRRHIDNEGDLTLWYKLLRPENVRQDRFQYLVDRITTDVGMLTTVYGTVDR